MKFWCIIFLMFSFHVYGQEICNNAIDDDGDGLIDLLDPDCHCGPGLNAQVSNAIPNPGFNNSSCCPPAYWTSGSNNLNCVDDWSTDVSTNWNNGWQLSYLNSCDSCGQFNQTFYTTPEECSTSVNNGFLGMGFYNWQNNNTWWNNSYANACLNTTLLPGNNYTLQFDAFNNWGNFNWNSWNNIVDISIFGTTSCANVPIPNQACASGNWDGLDSLSIAVPADSAWHTYTFTFSPTVPINAIALGQSCTSSSNNTVYNWNRLLLDNLFLMYSKLYDLQIAESGYYCTNDYLLSSSIDTVGGSWQWYKDSIAIVGETNDTLDITNLGSGDYTVLYTLSGNCQGETISTTPPTYPYAFASTSNGCEDDSLLFNGTGFVVQPYLITDYLWNFGNGDTSILEDPYYTYTSPGIYQVYFVAFSNLGCPDTVFNTVEITPKPIIDFSLSGQCLYDSIGFVNLSTIPTGTIDSISWDFDNGSFGLDSIEYINYGNFGNYNIELFAVSDAGCSDSVTIPYFVNAVPNAILSGLDTCSQATFNFINNSNIAIGNIVTNTWDFGDFNTSNLQSPNHAYLTDGTYDVELIVESDSGCVDTSSISIISHPNPIAAFNQTSACFYAEFENTSSINTGSIISTDWNFGDNAGSTIESPSHYYQTNNTFIVELAIESDFGCTDVITQPIIIFSDFEADFQPDKTLICEDDCVIFTNTSSGGSGTPTYLWTTSDGVSSASQSPTFCFENSNDYSEYKDIYLKITTSTGCIDSILYSNIIEVVPYPTAFFTYSPNKVPLSEPIVQFTNLSTLAANNNWNFGDNSTSSEINPEHVYPDIASSYSIELVVSDATETCQDTYQSTLVVEDEIIFYIPNVFTPDGNSFNEYFTPQFYSGIDIYQFRMQIYNRWGELIFESYDSGSGWNGFYADKLVDEGTYVWKIDFHETMSDKRHTHTGHVTVLR